MSLLCSSLPSTSGPIIKRIAPRPVLFFLYPLECVQTRKSQLRTGMHHQKPGRTTFTTTGLEAWLYNSLSCAGHSQKHLPKFEPSANFFPPKRLYTYGHTSQNRTPARRRYHAARNGASKNIPEPEPRNRTKEELIGLVDQYGGSSFTDQLPLLEAPNLYQPSDGPNLTVSDKSEDEWPPPFKEWYADEEVTTKVRAIRIALEDWSRDPEELYQLYRDLPEPRAPYLDAKCRHKFLRHLSVVERKDEQTMLRYMSVVDDMKRSAIPLNTAEWTSALSFMSRYVAVSTDVEVEAALQMWKEMEHEAGVRGNETTFNVLFDVACKAGKFTLAEMIYQEMQKRNLEFNRYHHVSMIFYYGMKQNGDGARAAYRNLVEAGEVVDTVVLNAMISALIRSQEPSIAENIYERMKRSHLDRPGFRLPSRSYKDRRDITRILMRMARIGKRDAKAREYFQQNFSVFAPNIHTYRILLNYFAVKAGELDKCVKFLDEMNWFQIPLHGALLLALLKGFHNHGGIRYTHWTSSRLESVWASYMTSLDSDNPDLRITRWQALWGLRAFVKCSGKLRAMEVWEDLNERWNPSDEDHEFIMRNLTPLLQENDRIVI